MPWFAGEDTCTPKSRWGGGFFLIQSPHLSGYITSGNLQGRFVTSLRRLSVSHRLWRHRPCPFVLCEPYFEAEEKQMKKSITGKAPQTDPSPAHHEVRAVNLKKIVHRVRRPWANRLTVLANTCTSQNPSWTRLSCEHSRNTRSAKDHYPSSNKRFETTPKC